MVRIDISRGQRLLKLPQRVFTGFPNAGAGEDIVELIEEDLLP